MADETKKEVAAEYEAFRAAHPELPLPSWRCYPEWMRDALAGAIVRGQHMTAKDDPYHPDNFKL